MSCHGFALPRPAQRAAQCGQPQLSGSSMTARTLKARSGVIQSMHDALHDLGVYVLDTREEGKELVTEE